MSMRELAAQDRYVESRAEEYQYDYEFAAAFVRERAPEFAKLLFMTANAPRQTAAVEAFITKFNEACYKQALWDSEH